MKIEEAAAKSERYCKVHREIIKLIPAIRRVLARFDGKVYNKRLVTALDKEAEKIESEKKLYFTAEKSMSGERVFIYGHIRMEYQNQPILCRLILKDGRIDAEQGIISCREQYEEITKKCAELENGVQIMPQLIARLDELHRQQQALIKQIPHTLYYDYDIKHVLEYGAAWVFPEMKKPAE